MTITTILIIFILGVAFIGFLLYMSYVSAEDKKKWREDLILTRGTNKADLNHASSAKKEEKTKREGVSKKLKNSTAALMESDDLSLNSIQYLLVQANIDIPVIQYWFYAAISGGISFLLSLSLMGDNFIAVILITITGFIGLPYFVLKRKVKKRQAKILTELPDCLDGMVRLLKSGMPISEAIAMTARQNPGPIGEEMSKVYEAQRVGDTLPEAVDKFAFRAPLPELKMFATAISIQVKTGASLSDILSNLANVIRERFKLKRKVKALSSEAKASAGIIAALPFLVVTALYFLNPEYITLLWTTETGMFMLYVAFGWMSVGVFVMKQMINFKI